MVRDNANLVHNAKKLSERLIVIFQHNMAQGIDPCESDILLIEELMEFFDRSSLSWVKNSDIEAEDFIQTDLFKDK